MKKFIITINLFTFSLFIKFLLIVVLFYNYINNTSNLKLIISYEYDIVVVFLVGKDIVYLSSLFLLLSLLFPVIATLPCCCLLIVIYYYFFKLVNIDLNSYTFYMLNSLYTNRVTCFIKLLLSSSTTPIYLIYHCYYEHDFYSYCYCCSRIFSICDIYLFEVCWFIFKLRVDCFGIFIFCLLIFLIFYRFYIFYTKRSLLLLILLLSLID